MTPHLREIAPRVRYGTAADVTVCATLYAQGFERGLRALFGRLPHTALLEDALIAYLAAEPQGFLIWAATDAGPADGYVLVTRSLTALIRRVVFSRAVPRALGRLLRGDYGIGQPRVIAHALGEAARFARSSGKFRVAGDAQIVSIAVRDGLRGAGAGHALMRAGLSYLEAVRVPEVRLEVQPDNEPAQRLYRRLGFVQRGEIPSPLGKALVMTRALSATNSNTGEESDGGSDSESAGR